MSRPFESKELLWKWHTSQILFYENLHTPWAKRQCHWHRQQRARIFTFTEVLVRTMQKHQAQLSNSVQKHNSLLQHLRITNHLRGE